MSLEFLTILKISICSIMFDKISGVTPRNSDKILLQIGGTVYINFMYRRTF